MPLTDKQKIGNLGEDIACRFLVKHGFVIKDRNYRKKWGELDIIAKKDNFLHFIEVKTIRSDLDRLNKVGPWLGHNPEENVHPWKQKRLGRAIQTYLLEKDISENTEWVIDVIAVFLDFKTRKAKIRMTENIILG